MAMTRRRRAWGMRRSIRFTPIRPMAKRQTRMPGRRVGRNLTPGTPRRVGRFRPMRPLSTRSRRRGY
jgi:hypothetical protein